ncbi:MAG: hypothetical protein E6H71_08015 [Betaproteobacteria bacterium]|nr:MAG: hypothetical protein E6H71_08015 [Betaproteobacteria bacterium]
MNHPIVFRPMRPSDLLSPMCAMPTTSVEKTSGAIIILMSRRKMSVTSEIYPATVLADSGVGNSSWHIQPTPMPATIPMRIHVVSLLFIASLPLMLSLFFMLKPSSGERRDFEARRRLQNGTDPSV